MAAVAALFAALLAGCLRQPTPTDVALEYGRAVYASDAQAIYRLLSEADRRARDEATFRAQVPAPAPFTREVLRQLAGYANATPVETKLDGPRATVRLKFRLPDANAPAVAALLLDWDDDRLAKLGDTERSRITARLAGLHRAGTLPMVEGEETMTLVKDPGGWRVFRDWASGVRLSFAASAAAGLPLELGVSPVEVVVSPGERLRVTLVARNASAAEITTRVGHVIEPARESRYLALLQCPLFVPITFGPGERREFASVYLVLDDTPRTLRALDVRYAFERPAGDRTAR